jgi:Spy/CpxP family protein refolding chaperone
MQPKSNGGRMKSLLILTLAVAIAIPALSQTTSLQPPNPADRAQHEVQALTTLLTLTAAQQTQALGIFTTSAKSEEGLHQTDRQLHDSLQAAVKNNDTASIEQLASSLGQSMAHMTSIRAKAEASFYQILTPEQQSKLSDLEAQHLGPLAGPHGPGGPPPSMAFH